MQYLMLVMTEPIDKPVAEELDIESWVTRHDASGARLFGDRLADASEAVTVRVRADGTQVKPGPASPAHAAIEGLDILEAPSLDEAIAIATEHPMARGGLIQVWPFFDRDAEE